MSKLIEAAARLLGCKPDEVARVDDSPAGQVIVTRDGTSYIDVPDDNPDGEGKTGLMLLAAPSEKPVKRVDGHTSWNSFPLYVMPADTADDEDTTLDNTGDMNTSDIGDPAGQDGPAGGTGGGTDPAAEIREDLESRSHDELKELVRQHDLDVKLNSKAEVLIDALVPVLAAKGDS